MSQNKTSIGTNNPNELLKIPNWINEQYFETILENDIEDYIRIKKFLPIAATAPGENYTSIMVRIIIDIELKGVLDSTECQVSYILKTTLDNGDSAALVNDCYLFPKERQMYDLHIPRFIKLYKEAGFDVKLAPRCLHIDYKSPENISLVLEDLKMKKFTNVNRLEGFDLKHMCSVLHKLAEFHAASAVNYQQNGPYDEMFDITFYTEKNRKLFEMMSAKQMQLYLKAMREWGLENVEYYINVIPDPMLAFDEALYLNNVDPEEFNVLNHGDCWANNIMFNYKENGEIDETIFVDLQVCKWGSPAQDLWYLIVTSANIDIRVREFDKFVQIYHTRLVECLKMLKYNKPIPTLKQLHIMMLRYGFWGLLTANSTLVVVLFPSDKDANMSSMMDQGPAGEAFRYKTLTNPIYAKAMCQLLPFFMNKGVLCLTKRQ